VAEPPAQPKIFHIVHVDRLASILADGRLRCDADMVDRDGTGTVIGMSKIKLRRLNELSLASHPGLRVGQCVPFYFCQRSVMLYLIWQANHPDLAYRGGQAPIIHLQADVQATAAWASGHGLRWAFTLSNAGARYFEDRSDLSRLEEINWDAVHANRWSGSRIPGSAKDGKQAEFLVEGHFPWELVEAIGVRSLETAQQVAAALEGIAHRPQVEIRREWYY
jgi:hypothetical protein